MTNPLLGEKVTDILKKLRCDEDQIALFWIAIGEAVTRQMEGTMWDVLTEDDLKKLEDMTEGPESEEFLVRRFKEITGEEPQAVSDEYTEMLLQKVVEGGYQEILNQVKEMASLD